MNDDNPEELTQGNVFIPFSTTPNWVRGGSEGNKNSKTKNAIYWISNEKRLQV